MNTIVSKSNERVKFIKSLNDKKYRNLYGAFYLEGIKVVSEILQNKKAIDIMFIAYSKELLLKANGGEKILSKLEKEDNIELICLDENIFSYVTDTITPQGVLAVVKIPKYDIDYEIKNCKTNILILDRVQDLGNIGTIIRSANAFLIDVIICTSGTADVYSPKVIRATMGAIFKVKVIYVDNILEIIDKLKAQKYLIIGTSLNKNNSLESLDYSKKHAYVMGNEAQGVKSDILNMCDSLVKIDMSNNIESLNVAVATSIILYEQYKKRK